MTDEEFIYKTLKRNEKRKSVITNSYNTQDFYLYYRKELNKLGKTPLDNSTFRKIIKEMHLEIRERLADGEIIELPYGAGEFVVTSYEPKAYLKDNKLKSNYRIDWNNTLKLWNNDEEAKKNKILLRILDKNIFSVRFFRNHCNYKNAEYIKFRTGRRFKLFLRDRVKSDNIIGHNLD